MAIKGNGYTKTSWTFEERPVASSKLNLWDDRIETALELVYNLLSLAWGGGDGVVRTPTGDDLDVRERDAPDMTVRVYPGRAFIAGMPFHLASAMDTPALTPPQTHPRVDLVQARLETWDATVKQGDEAVTPSAPSADTDCIPLAELYLRPGMTAIKDTDDGVNGYISDVRTYL